MFCSYCGAQLINPNQKFCHNCGKVIEDRIISKTPQLRTEGTQYAPTTVSAPTPRYTSIPVIQNISVKEVGGPGPLSVKCFVFALVSIGIAIIAVILGGGVFISIRLFGIISTFIYIMRIIMWIIVIIAQFVGLIFGMASRKNSIKARGIEPNNTLERLGKIFGIIGIIVNAIAIGLSLFIFPIIIFSPLFYN